MRQTSIKSPNHNWIWWRYILSLGAIGGIYVIAGYISGQIISLTPQLPLIWLPSGIMLAIVVLGGYRYTLGIGLGVVCLGLIREQSLVAMSALALSNIITISIGTYLLKSVWHININLKRIRDVILLVVWGGFGAMFLGSIAATIIISTYINYSTNQLLQQFLTLWIGSSLSVMFITPLIFAWVTDRTGTQSRHTWIEAVGLITFSMVLGWISHSNILQLQTTMPVFYLILPPIIWAMIRFRLREVTLVNTIMIGFMLWGAQTPQNIIHEMSVNNRLLFVWSTIAIGSVISLIVKVLIDERRMIEQTLKMERDTNAQILEALGQGISVVSKSGTYEYVNPAFANLLKMDADDLIGLSPYEIIADSFKPSLDNVFKSRQEGQASSYQAILKSSQGEEITVLTTGVTRYLNGAYDGSISVVTDIRPLLEAEQQLQQSETRFRAIFENSADSIILIDTSGKILMANHSHQQLLGYSAEELLTMRVPDYLNAKDSAYGEALFLRALDNKVASYQFELQYICKDKSIRWIDASVGMVWDQDGNHQYSVVISRDITESRSIKIAIENSEKRFRAIFENASIPIAVTRHNRQFGLVNRAYCNMLGYSAEELQQMKFDDITYPGDNDENTVKYQQLVDGEINHFTLTKRYIHKDGSVVWVNISVSRFEGTITLEDDPSIYTIAIAENITEQRLVEDELQRSETFLRAVFENSADSVVVVDETDSIVMSNPAHRSLVGYSADELSKMTVQDYVHPEDIEREEALFQQALQQRKDSYQIEVRFIRRDKSICWVDASVGIVRDKDGNYQHAIAVSRDITESRNIKLAIENSEKRFRAIFENASLPMTVTRADHYIDMANPAFCNLLGYTVEELQQMTYNDFTHPDDNIEDTDQFEKLVNKEIDYFTRIKRYIHKGGSIIWVNLSISLFTTHSANNEQESLYTVAIAEDITERKATELALKISEERYRSIFENALVGIYQSTMDGRFLSVNPTLIKMLGYDNANELYNLDIAQDLYVNPADRTSAQRLQSYIEADVLDHQSRLKKKNGDIIIVNVQARVIRDKSSNILYFEGTMVDITEQHRQAEEIKQLNQDLEQRVRERTEQLELANKQLLDLDRLRSKFIADISHEMRTPLAVLNTRLYLLQHRKDNDSIERHIEGFRTQLDRLEEFVENAFDISVIDMSRDNITYAEVSLNNIVENAVHALAPRAEIHGLDLIHELDPTLPNIIGVERHLSQVATNLVSNAIKYTSSGKIQVSTGQDSITNRVFLRVSDTGMGIADEDIPHLFSRFYRGQRAGQSAISGSGLGLSIVKEIVDAHEGHIDIESKINDGSTITVWLPIELTDLPDQSQDDAITRDE